MKAPALLFRLFWACIFLWLAPAHARDLVTEQGYWQDSAGTATFAQAREQVYTPYRSILNRGATTATTWLRVRINTSGSHPQDRHIVLRVQPNYIDEVEC